MLKLIYGTSGSGKTAQVTEAIRHDIENGIRCVLLVPEQQAYISERDLPPVLPSNAGLYFEVVNFSRLAEEVFRKYGGVTRSSASGGIRTLLMWETMRTLSEGLSRYGMNARSDATLIAGMLKATDDLRNNGVTPDDLEKAAEKLPSDHPLRQKLTDISAVAEGYRCRLEASFGPESADRLFRMAELLEQHRFFDGYRVYIDSFTSFTAPEYAVLSALLRQAECVTVTLCADEPHSTQAQFESVIRSAQRLCDLANRADIPVTRNVLTPPNGVKPEALARLAHDLWRFDLAGNDRRIPADHGKDSVHLLVCSNLYEESEAAALNILGLVQNGMHYGDITVVVRDTEAYRGVLDAALERYGIPYFLSERTDLSSKPLSRLILSALRAVSRGYRVQDILTLVKTGLCGTDARDAAYFEEYCETWHITGNRFRDDVWNMNPDGLTAERSPRADEILQAANRVKDRIMAPLLTLEAEMNASESVPERCRALYHYLSALDVAALLSERAGRELELGQPREAGETVRLYRFVTETLTELCDILPDSCMTAEEFLSALSLLFSGTDLGSVPNVHDCVMIGSAATLRAENVRASLLLGLCEGEFPQAVTDDGLLSEAEKDTLEQLGIPLDSRARTRSSDELLYVWRAMAKPKEQLFLSYPQRQPDGSERIPSLAFNRVRYLLDREAETFDFSLIRGLLPENTEKSDADLYKTKAFEAGTRLSLSQSSIRTFLLCPYNYYCTYQLKLREKKDSSPSSADDGTFLHYVFEQFLRGALEKDGVLRLPAPEALPAIAERIVNRYMENVCPITPETADVRLLHLYDRLRALSIVLLRDITGEIAASRFRPRYLEQSIGGHGENALAAPILTLNDNSTVTLHGKIDRVDVFEQGDKVFIRVVDYKSGNHEFSLDQIRNGLDLQLILYLFAVTASDPAHILPAGAQYIACEKTGGKINVKRRGILLNEPEILSAVDTSESGAFSAKLIRQTADEIRQLTEQMKETVCGIGKRILGGTFEKTPSEDACRFCPVRFNCDRAVISKN